jgi:predicted enzyme related to lactoylglutathione lyase
MSHLRNQYLTLLTMIALTLVNDEVSAGEEQRESMARVTGIGGVFFLSRDKGSDLSAWYEQHLGIKIEDFGAAIMQWQEDNGEDNGVTIWHVADGDSDWFSPSESTFMINYRVNDLEAMVEQLTEAGIDIQRGPEYHENGIFAWILDPDGNKLELWEPKIWDEKNKR